MNETQKDAGAELATLLPVLRDLVQTLNRQIEWFDRQVQREDKLRVEQRAREDELRAQALAREDQVRDQAQAREDQLREVIRAELTATSEWMGKPGGSALPRPLAAPLKALERSET